MPFLFQVNKVSNSNKNWIDLEMQTTKVQRKRIMNLYGPLISNNYQLSIEGFLQG